MIIDFANMPETMTEHFRGGAGTAGVRRFADPLNRILYIRLQPGASVGEHTHDTGSEIMYFLKGQGKVIYDGQAEEVRAGMCHYCPKGHGHTTINDSQEDLEIFAVVSEQ